MDKSPTWMWVLVVLGALAVGSAFAGGNREAAPPSRDDQVVKAEETWRQELTPEEYHVLREKGTERPFTGDLWDDHEPGVYVCAGCGLELFHSDHKFESGTGWPSFFQPVSDGVVDRHTDSTLGMTRTEITCARCGGHLGHVFRDGPKPTGERHCVNSVSLDKRPATPAPAPAPAPAQTP